MRKQFCLLCGLLLALFLYCSMGLSTATLSTGMHAVPAPAKMSIDGKLNEWDLSGRVLICSDIESFRDTFSAQVSMMYDADNLYYAIEWRDATPMSNQHDPKTDNYGWAGDCVQLRIRTDRIVHATCWYYAANREPYIGLDFGKGTASFGGGQKRLFQVDGWKMQDGVEMAFLQNADGKGYVQEIKFPWAVITETKRYQPGDEINCGFDLLWGEGKSVIPSMRMADNVKPGTPPANENLFRRPADWGPVTLEKTGNLKLPAPAWEAKLTSKTVTNPVKLRYQLPTDGPLPKTYRVTLAITDPANPDWIVSQPVAGAVRTVTEENKGQFEETWDGLDDNHMPVPVGKYGVKGIYLPAEKWGITGEYHALAPKIAVAAGDSFFPAREEDDKLPWFWAAGGGGVADIAIAPGGRAALLRTYMEGDSCWMLDLNTPINWHQVTKNYYASGNAVATDGEGVWAFWGSCIYRPDGKAFGKESMGKFAQAYRTAGTVVGLAAWRDPASKRGYIYAAQAGKANILQVLDADTATLLHEYPLSTPLGLTVVGGKVLTLLQKTADGAYLVSELNLNNGAPVGEVQQRFVVRGITHPTDLERDAHRNYYISDIDANQVYQLSSKGKITRTFGKGTRQSPGEYNKLIFMSPQKLALWTDAKGQDRLLVIEQSGPERVSEWTTGGKFLREWIPGIMSADSGYVADPECPEDIYVPASDPYTGKGLIRFKVDYAKGTWKVDAVWPDICGNAATVKDFPGGVSHPQMFVVQGRKYLAFARHHYDAFGYMIYRQDGKRWVPSAALVPQSDTWNFRQAFWWHDANGDGQLQEEEYKDNPANLPSGPRYWGNQWLDDLSLTWIQDDTTKVWRIAPSGFDRFGNPIFRGSDWQVMFTEPIYTAKVKGTATPLYGGNELGVKFHSWTHLDGNVRDGFVMAMRGGPDVDANFGAQIKITRNVPDGKGGYTQKWRTGRSSMGIARPGELYSALFISAPINGLFGVQDSAMGGMHIYTDDGLYVDTLFVDGQRFPRPQGGVYSLSGENFSGHIFPNEKDGKVYVAMCANSPCALFEVPGWTKTSNPVRPLALQTTTIDIAADQIAPPTENAANLRGISAKRLARFFPAPANGPVLDGSLTGWENVEPVAFQADADHRMEVRGVYSADTLYLRMQVEVARQVAIPAITEVRRIFTHNVAADTISFYLQGNPNAPTATSANGRPGDVRVVFGLVKDGAQIRPIALGVYPKWTGAGQAEPLSYISPVGTVNFEHVGLLNDIKLAYRFTDKQQGFIITAAIPRSVLPAVFPAMTPGLKTRTDFDATLGGLSKTWWANSDGSAGKTMYDDPSEARLYPNSWAPLEFVGD